MALRSCTDTWTYCTRVNDKDPLGVGLSHGGQQVDIPRNDSSPILHDYTVYPTIAVLSISTTSLYGLGMWGNAQGVGRLEINVLTEEESVRCRHLIDSAQGLLAF